METEEAIYFFGKDHPKFGFLSNFYPCRFVDLIGEATSEDSLPKKKNRSADRTNPKSITYISSEQFYVHQKIVMFDRENQELIDELFSSDIDPQKVKKIGRRVNNFDGEAWSIVRCDVMSKGLYLKFSQNRRLKEQLLKTRDKIIFESSPHDAVWGIGYGPTDAQSIPVESYGLNLLGKCLMEVRERLRSEGK